MSSELQDFDDNSQYEAANPLQGANDDNKPHPIHSHSEGGEESVAGFMRIRRGRGWHKAIN